MLSDKLSNYFTSGVRNRGRSYFQNGSVTILAIDGDGHVAAEVIGSDIYTVTLDPQRKRMVGQSARSAPAHTSIQTSISANTSGQRCWLSRSVRRTRRSRRTYAWT